jgi:hypothetical protein
MVSHICYKTTCEHTQALHRRRATAAASPGLPFHDCPAYPSTSITILPIPIAWKPDIALDEIGPNKYNSALE